MSGREFSDAEHEDRVETQAKEDRRDLLAALQTSVNAAKQERIRTRRSGFCAKSNPPDSHARCAEHVADCPCECHTDADATSSATDEVAPMVLGAPGFWPDVPEAAYHAHLGSLSVSGAKVLLRAPALFKWERDNPKPFKKVFEYGSAAHGKVLGTGAEIRVIPAKMLASNGAASTADAKAFIEQARKDGAVPLKQAEADQVRAMADKLSEHSLAMELLSEGQPEVSAFAIDEGTGVLRRGRFDWLGTEILTDYKTASTSDPAAFGRTAADLGYHMQAAWYLNLAHDLGHPAEAFAFLVQSKEPPYLVTVVELDDEALTRGRELNRRALERFRDCTESGIWPGYLPDTEFARVSIPRWALSDSDRVEVLA